MKTSTLSIDEKINVKEFMRCSEPNAARLSDMIQKATAEKTSDGDILLNMPGTYSGPISLRSLQYFKGPRIN